MNTKPTTHENATYTVTFDARTMASLNLVLCLAGQQARENDRAAGRVYTGEEYPWTAQSAVERVEDALRAIREQRDLDEWFDIGYRDRERILRGDEASVDAGTMPEALQESYRLGEAAAIKADRQAKAQALRDLRREATEAVVNQDRDACGTLAQDGRLSADLRAMLAAVAGR